MKVSENRGRFPGLPPDWETNFWKFPRMLEEFLFTLNGAETKVFIFILRQTIGYRGPNGKPKTSDRISTSQFQKGIGIKNKGTGLSKNSIIGAIKGLVEKGFIRIEKEGYQTKRYELVVQKMNNPGSNTEQDSAKNEQICSANSEQAGGAKNEQTIDNYPIDNNTNKKEIIDKKIEERILSLYQKNIHSGARMTNNARMKIAERLQQFDLVQIEKAILKFSRDDWRMNNNRAKGMAWFFATEDRIDEFSNFEWWEDEDAQN